MSAQTTLPSTAPRVTQAPAGSQELPAARTRLVYLDNLRLALITAVVVGHVAVTYGAMGDWFYHEAGETSLVASIIFTPLLGIGASFLLGLFFMIAAYLTPRAYERKGAARFVADRLLRLGIPLLIFMFFFNPLNECAVAAHGDASLSFWDCVPLHLPSMAGSGVSVMWFVELLLIFSLLYVVWRLLAGRNGGALDRRKSEPRTAAVPGHRAIALFALALGLATFLIRLWQPVGRLWEPPHLELAHLPQYVFAFVAGLAAYRGGWFEGLVTERVRVWRWVALAGALLMPVIAIAAGALTGELSPDGAGGFNWLSLAYSLWEGFAGVAMAITVLAWFRSRFSRQSGLAAAMAGTSYAVYFLHPPIVVLTTLALSGLQMNMGLKFIVVAPLAVALCYGIGYAVRRLPLVRLVL